MSIIDSFKVMILDFDGVLVESVGIKDQAFEQLYEDVPDHIDQIMEYHLTHNATIRFKQFKYIAEVILQQEYTPEMEKGLSERFSELVFHNIAHCTFVGGALEFLNYFSEIIPIYIASVSPEGELKRILEAKNIRHFFKKVYADPWIKTDAFQAILAKEKLSSKDALFIGDMPEDYHSAKKSNIFFIGRKSRSEFPVSDIPIFNDLIEIKAYLTSAET